jgi:hypothetical protein
MVCIMHHPPHMSYLFYRKKGCLVYYKVSGNTVPICNLSYKDIQALTKKNLKIVSTSGKPILTVKETGTFTDDAVDACQKGPCLNAGTCSKKGASFTCACNECYSGTSCADWKATSFKKCADWFFDLTFEPTFPGSLLGFLQKYLQSLIASALGEYYYSTVSACSCC